MILPQITLPKTLLNDVSHKIHAFTGENPVVTDEAIGLILLAENESLLEKGALENVKHCPNKINQLAFQASIALESQANQFRSKYSHFSFSFRNFSREHYEPRDDDYESVNLCIEVSMSRGIQLNLALKDDIPANLQYLSQILAQEIREKLPSISSESLVDCTMEEEEYCILKMFAKKHNKPITPALYKKCIPKEERLIEEDEDIASFIETLGWYDQESQKNKLFGTDKARRITFNEYLPNLTDEDKAHPVYMCFIFIS